MLIKSLYNFNIIFKKSIKILLIINMINAFLCLFFILDITRLMKVLGDIIIIEAAFFFIFGGLKGIFNTPIIVSFFNFFNVKNKQWTLDELKQGEKEGLVYIVVALGLTLETIILAYLQINYI